MQLPKPSSRGRGRAHRLFHPLCGATLGTLVRLLAQGGVAPERLHVAAVALAVAALRLPFTAAEAAYCGILLRARAPGPAPVFIVGHWRSGTTHLANLLSRSPAFGILSPMDVGLPAEALGLARAARPFIEQFFPRTRLIDAISLASDLPQEDEMALANLSTLSCNHGIYFPGRLQREFDRGLFGEDVSSDELARWSRRLHGYVEKMSSAAAGRPLLIRNPASSTRIPLLRLLWPDARFIHIHRHPARVYGSSVHMMRTLVRELSLGAREADVAGLVRHVYPRLMTRLLQAGDAAPPDRFVEVRHEDLASRPLEELERIHRVLSLPGFTTAVPRFSAYLAGLGDHVAASHALAPADTSWIKEHCAVILQRLRYDPE